MNGENTEIKVKQENWDQPATKKQRGKLRFLMAEGYQERLPLEEWRNLTKGVASELIAAALAKKSVSTQPE